MHILAYGHWRLPLELVDEWSMLREQVADSLDGGGDGEAATGSGKTQSAVSLGGDACADLDLIDGGLGLAAGGAADGARRGSPPTLYGAS